MKQFTATDNLSELTSDKDWSMLYFSAAWCGPCKSMSPVMEQVAGHFEDKINTIKLDIDNTQEIASQYGLRGVPTIVLLHKGKKVDSIVGARPRHEVELWLYKHL